MACIRVATAPAAVVPISSSVSRWPSSESNGSSSASQAVALAKGGGGHLHLNKRLSFENGGFLPDRFGNLKVRSRTTRCDASSSSDGTTDSYLPELQVPRAWMAPQVAAEEAEWLRGALHQWLDDEFCPEPANEEISKRCAKVLYYCLLEEQLDVGDILMQMVRDLETFSFKESFHGAFSSANAAIDLITRRMRASDRASSN